MASEENGAKSEWYVRGPQGVLGPFSASRLRELAREGKLDPNALVRRGGEGAWNRAASVKGLSFQRASAHDVFVSYSNRDKAPVDGIIHCLEEQGIRCWVAPRDITPGANWGEAIIRAIESCRVLVLVLSKHSNASQQILQEVERAVTKGLIIVPFRIEDVPVSSKLELYVGARHWLDAYSGSLEKHALELASVLRSILAAGPEARARPVHSAPREVRSKKPWVLMAGVGVAAVLGVAFLGWQWMSGESEKGVDAAGRIGKEDSSAPTGEDRSSPPAVADVERSSPPRMGRPEVPAPDEDSAGERAAVPSARRNAESPQPSTPKEDPLAKAATAALEHTDDLESLSSTFSTWSKVAAYRQPKPSPEQAAHLDAFTKALSKAAVPVFDPQLRDQELFAELDALEQWADQADCEALAGLSEHVYRSLTETLFAEIEKPSSPELDALLPALRTLAGIAERGACGHPRGQLLGEIVSRCVAAVHARMPAAESTEDALRGLLALDRFAQEIEDGRVREAILDGSAEFLALVEQALQGGKSLQESLTAYAAVAEVPLDGEFQLLAPRIVALAQGAERNIESQAKEPEDLTGLKGSTTRLDRFAQGLPEKSPLDGDASGRVVNWCNHLRDALDKSLAKASDAALGEIEGALSGHDWKRAESLARQLTTDATKESEPYWLAMTLQAEAMFGYSKIERWPPIVNLFKTVVRGTENDATLKNPCARASCGLARVCIDQARDALSDAKDAIAKKDWRRMRNDESKYSAADTTARSALGSASAAGAQDQADELRDALNKAAATWKREVEPNLVRSK